MELIFTNPNYLFLFVLVPIISVLLLFFKKRYKKNSVTFANFDLIKKAINIAGEPNFFFLDIIRLLFLILLIFTLSSPVVLYEKEMGGSNYVFVLDSSVSMLVKDVGTSRFFLSKEFIENIVKDSSSSSKLGLVSYSSNVKIHQSLSANKQDFFNSLNKLEPTTKSNTQLVDALITSANLFQEEEMGNLVLLTDSLSDANLDNALDYIVNKNLHLSIIGVGTIEGGVIPETNITFKLDETFQKIGDLEDITYFNLKNRDFSNAKSSVIVNSVVQEEKQLITYSLILLLILYLLKLVLINTIYKIEP